MRKAHRLPLLAVLGSLCAVLAGCGCERAEDWVTYTSPAGAYSLAYPRSWKTELEDDILNIFPADEKCAVTVSAYVGDTVSDEELLSLLAKAFKAQVATSSPAPVSGKGWQGFRQTFREVDDPIEWIAINCRSSHVLVLITVNCEAQVMDANAQLFERILNSLSLSQSPSRTTRGNTETHGSAMNGSDQPGS